ncbi:MAG: hypothetical protein K5754_10825 [Butyrivibrio sp.]|nr:hypothetical protein [Butyrivibrio sp.]
MIKTRADLKYYIECDRAAYGIEKKFTMFFPSYRIYNMQKLYRKTEYLYNNKNLFNYMVYLFYKIRLKIKLNKLNSEIPLNVFEEGLVIWHGQNIIVNSNARVGKNFSISAGCCIGQAHNAAPTIGDNVEMTIGSRVLGGIHVCNDVTIGAGALVVKSIDEPYTTWGGVPARIISKNLNQYVADKKIKLERIYR